MARAKQGPVRTQIETRYFDESGQEVYTANYREEIIISADGAVTSLKLGENALLVSGEAYNPSMSAGAKPVMLVGVCAICRDSRPLFPWLRPRKTHGLCNVAKLKHCCDCRQSLCPRHQIRSRYDGQWRCPQCHKRHKWLLRLKSVFFERVRP